MRLIVLSPPNEFPNEAQHVTALFQHGLELFHLRKPTLSERQLERYLQSIPAQYHSRIVTHSHYPLAAQYGLRGIHLPEKPRESLSVDAMKKNLKGRIVSTSFHTLDALCLHRRRYEYVFISPVFDSISKPRYRSSFTLEALHETLVRLNERKHYIPQVMALGGIDARNVQKLKPLGFAGVAVLGAVWKSGDPVQAYLELTSLLK